MPGIDRFYFFSNTQHAVCFFTPHPKVGVSGLKRHCRLEEKIPKQQSEVSKCWGEVGQRACCYECVSTAPCGTAATSLSFQHFYKLSTFHLTAWSPGNYSGMVFLKTKGSDSLSCAGLDPFEVRPKEKRADLPLVKKKNYR